MPVTNRYPFEIEPFGRAFAEHDEATVVERIGFALLESAKYRSIDWTEGALLPTVCPIAPNAASYFTFGSGVAFGEEAFAKLADKHPQFAPQLQEIQETLAQFTTGKHLLEAIKPEEWRLVHSHAFWAGTWIGHGNPDYHRLLHLGTNGLRDLIAQCQAQNPERVPFYHACLLTLEAIDLIGRRVREEATEKARQPGPQQKEWLRIRDDFQRIPQQPAFDLHSAAMLFWLVFTFDGVDSPGRMDYFLLDYAKSCPPVEAETIITRLLEGMHYVRAWNVCLSGSTPEWKDETTDFALLILRRVKEMHYQTPNLTVRVHRNTPDKFWEAIADSLAAGTGLPAIYNDEVVCPALEQIGISPQDSHQYCLNGCNQIDIFGKSHIGLEDGEVNLAKVLELTLHNGRDYAGSTPQQIAPAFGDARRVASFGELLDLYYQNLDYITDLACDIANRCQKIYAEIAPNPLRSCLIQDCLETGHDYKNGGPRYGHGQILAEGIADTADSLWALEKLVFQQHKYTMDQVVAALEDDFAGHDVLHHDFQNCDKFGNDLKGPDTICAAIVDHFMKRLKQHQTFRGGVFTGGCSPFSRAAENGAAVAALPNGKKAHDPQFADAIGATPGCDTHGPTAALKSMMRYDQREAGSGFITQLKFTKTLFDTPEGKRAFIALAKTYFANGGQQLSVNVLNREALLEAQKEPEKHRDLIVRVGGYSEYFCNLTPELRQNVIDRAYFNINN